MLTSLSTYTISTNELLSSWRQLFSINSIKLGREGSGLFSLFLFFNLEQPAGRGCVIIENLTLTKLNMKKPALEATHRQTWALS